MEVLDVEEIDSEQEVDNEQEPNSGLSVALLRFLIRMTIFSLLFTFPTMWLWNFSIATIFDIGIITDLQALSLNILSWLLIKTPK